MTDAEDVGRMSEGGNNERGEGGGESRVIRLSSTLQSKLVNKHPDNGVQRSDRITYRKECSITQLGISSSIERLKFK